MANIGASINHGYNAVMKKINSLILASIILVSLSACKGKSENQVTPIGVAVELTPYLTATMTPSPTALPPNAPTAILVPSSTPTPRVYEVKANDTLIVIAFKNGLTLDELLAANPNVNAYSLTIGTKLLIPAAKVAGGTQTIPTATPVPVFLNDPYCYQTITGGLDCFALAENRGEFDLQNLTAEFRLTDPQTGEVLTQSSFLPLNRLDTGTSMPLHAYFPPPVFDLPDVTLQLLSATVSNETNKNNYLLMIEEPLVEFVSNGKSVTAEGIARLEGVDIITNFIRIAAVAYDALDKVVGVRFYEEKSELRSGDEFNYRITVYSSGGAIKRVEVFGEALP